MQEKTFRRVDVGVTLKVSPEGNVWPLTITFENGKTYTIDRLKERKRAAATKVGGTGIRYTVVIQNREGRCGFGVLHGLRLHRFRCQVDGG